MSRIPLEKTARFVVSLSVRARQLDDELVLLDLRQGEYFSLNASGAAVWNGLERGLDLAAIDEELAGRWPVEAPARWNMLEDLVGDFLARGLVEQSG
ncbi:MAG: PqqD family protein [Gemmatimonadota bacterium]